MTHVRSVAVVAMFVLGACDRVFQLVDVEAKIDADITLLPDGATCFFDGFDFINQTVWIPTAHATTASALSTNGQLVVTLSTSPDKDNYAGVTSLTRRDVTGAGVQLEILEVPAQAPGTETAFQLTTIEGEKFKFSLVESSLRFMKVLAPNGEEDIGDGPIPFLMDTHHYWRFQFDAGETLHFFTADVEGTWTPRRSIATTRSNLTNTNTLIHAGTFAMVGAPGKARFDNFYVDCP
jgi:hypothetical protein